MSSRLGPPMTSFPQFEADRRNALRSTGPHTEDGKRQSRVNAVRHGLTAETVIGSLEDSDDYKAFEAAVTADYDARTAAGGCRSSTDIRDCRAAHSTNDQAFALSATSMDCRI